jgi:polynucleotide 5'-hydroxyl-kinase GRC3/NOL9
MSSDWADKIAQRLLIQGLVKDGLCLILGAADTGKTTLAAALAKNAVSSQSIGIIDADIGQSHIGPPATVGWALADDRKDFSQLPVNSISFVGDVTPVGHLLQLTAAIVQCFRQASETANLIIIDTPGLIHGPAAAALWWTVQQILKPASILAVQRKNELSDILVGFGSIGTKIELISSPAQIPIKSRQARQSYRRSQFEKYFQSSDVYNISLTEVAIRRSRTFGSDNLAHRLIALRDGSATDLAIGVIIDWRQNKNVVMIRAPKVDIKKVCCLVIGDVFIDIDTVLQA